MAACCPIPPVDSIQPRRQRRADQQIVSPAAVCALRESDSMTNPLLMPHYTITVIYQDRVTPLASEQVDPSATAA
jgi:hypothetical protein